MMSYDHYPVEMDFIPEEAALPDYCDEPLPLPVVPNADQVADDINDFMHNLYDPEDHNDFICTFITAAHYVLRHDDAQIFLWDHRHIALTLLAHCVYVKHTEPSLLGVCHQLEVAIHDILTL
jgi:hypothetical protein